MAKAFLRPTINKAANDGSRLKVRNPISGTHFKEAGELVELDTYFRRRIKEGSLEVVDQSASPADSAKNKKG